MQSVEAVSARHSYNLYNQCLFDDKNQGDTGEHVILQR